MVKYSNKVMCVFKDENGQQYSPINHIFADELIRDRENGYITLQMKDEHIFFQTHVKSVRMTRNKMGNYRGRVAYIHINL